MKAYFDTKKDVLRFKKSKKIINQIVFTQSGYFV